MLAVEKRRKIVNEAVLDRLNKACLSARVVVRVHVEHHMTAVTHYLVNIDVLDIN